jgi:hypothetical protein
MRDSASPGRLKISLDEVSNRRLISAQLVWFIVWCMASIGALVATPNVHGHGTHTSLGLPACPSVQVFDRPCPGCGLTTAFAWMVRGDVGRAAKAHALGPFMYLLLTGTAWLGLYGWIRSRRWVTGDAGNWFMIAFAAVFICYGVVRFALVKYNSEFYMMNKLPFSAPVKSGMSEKGGNAPRVPETDSAAQVP